VRIGKAAQLAATRKKMPSKTETGVSSPHAGFVAHNLWEIMRDMRAYPVARHFILLRSQVNPKILTHANYFVQNYAFYWAIPMTIYFRKNFCDLARRTTWENDAALCENGPSKKRERKRPHHACAL
jgi:hypothetical protein